jgi:hypothetical protein
MFFVAQMKSHDLRNFAIHWFIIINHVESPTNGAHHCLIPTLQHMFFGCDLFQNLTF